jgi:RNA polymerase sigma factor (sigma-70 family)
MAAEEPKIDATNHPDLELDKSLRQLIVDSRNGIEPEEGFRQIFLKAVLRSYELSLADQKDCLQEVMFRIFRFRFQYDAEQPILPWIFAITRNVARDQRTKNISRRETVAIDSEQIERTDGGTEHVRIVTTAQCEELLSRISDDEAAMLRLKYQDGYQVEELARVFNLSIDAMKHRLRLAKRRARNAAQRR